MNYVTHLTPVSSNVKTGPIPVSTSGRQTCSLTCPFIKNGCYAENYGLNFLWNKVTAGTSGTDWETFCTAISALPDGQLWRHNQAGDLPGNGREIDGQALGQLVEANIGRRGFTYTHYEPSIANNAQYIKGCNDFGFTVNLSANTLEHADKLYSLNIGPVAVVLESSQTSNCETPQGRKVVICPAISRDDTTCATCGLCAISDRKVIIGFPAHGTGAKKAEQAINFYSSAK